MEKNNNKNQLTIMRDYKQIVKILKKNDLYLFSVNGFNSLLPKFIYETLIDAKEREAFVNWKIDAEIAALSKRKLMILKERIERKLARVKK